MMNKCRLPHCIQWMTKISNIIIINSTSEKKFSYWEVEFGKIKVMLFNLLLQNE